MKRLIILFSIFCLWTLSFADSEMIVVVKKKGGDGHGTETWTTPGSNPWIALNSTVTVELWGAGGGGGGNNATSNGGGGGGGGSYVIKVVTGLTVGISYTVYVGNNGVGSANADGTAGEDSYFIDVSTVLAKGGAGGLSNANGRTGGAGGLASAGIGDTKYDGGWGETGRVSSAGRGGYGGSSGGTAADGLADGSSPSWTTVDPPAPPTGAGIGGVGGTGNGAAPATGNGGGGGGSGEGTNVSGGNGNDGKAILTW
jgi:hypothetical protein